jgi:hypothetical protein
MKRDCVFLLADHTMAEVFRAFLGRNQFHQSLGCSTFVFDPTQDIVVDEAGSDPGVYNRAHLLLEPYQNSHEHAVVVLDAAWDGSPGSFAIATGIEENLRSRWEFYAVVVIDPELEAWIWQDNQHVAEALHYRGNLSLREWLKQSGDWPEGHTKPPDPKAAIEKALRYTRIPRSAAVYRKVVSRISVHDCTDPAFHKLTERLRTWFPTETS